MSGDVGLFVNWISTFNALALTIISEISEFVADTFIAFDLVV